MTSNLAVYIKQSDNIQKFKDVLGNGANGYIQSVIIAASATEALMNCSEQSIVRAALRAASLGLSCDPAQKEAYLVPRKGKPVSNLIISVSINCNANREVLGYQCSTSYEGQEVKMGIDGLHFVYENGMKVDHFPVNRITAKIWMVYRVGWVISRQRKASRKQAYMSVEEIMGTRQDI